MKQHQTTLENLASIICTSFNLLDESYNVNQTRDLLKNTEPFDERKIFGTLGKYLKQKFEEPEEPNMNADEFSNISPRKSANSVINLIQRSDTQRFFQETKHKKIRIMLGGKPHLYYVDEPDLVLSRLIKLFSDHNQEPQACQILFCTNKTTLEEVTCFLFRCCYHALDFKRNLYCLVQPENLQNHITDEILSILVKKLREADAYFTIITVDRNNRWYTDLSIYLEELEVLTDDQSKRFYEKYIDNFNQRQSQQHHGKTDNPVCVVFMSDDECVGKTYQINRTCKRFKLECVHIPFNSPKVDKDFVLYPDKTIDILDIFSILYI